MGISWGRISRLRRYHFEKSPYGEQKKRYKGDRTGQCQESTEGAGVMDQW